MITVLCNGVLVSVSFSSASTVLLQQQLPSFEHLQVLQWNVRLPASSSGTFKKFLDRGEAWELNHEARKTPFP